MKKRTLLILILLIAALTAAGCGNNGLADYKKAAEKTKLITKGQCSADFSLNMDFNTEGMSREEISELEYYKSMSGSFRASFDEENDLGIYRNYLNLGGLGFDFDLYQNGEEVFVKLPVVGKYMKLEDMLNQAGQTPAEQSPLISEDTLETLGAEWVGMLKKEDVFKGKDLVLTTPDGEVKTTVYTITLNGSQVKAFEEKAIDVLLADENLRSNIESMIRVKADGKKSIDFDHIAAKLKEHILNDTVESFQYTAYVDIDGYIVNETLEIAMKRDARLPGEPAAIRFRLDMKNWDINKDQTFDFPELTEDNTMKSESLKESMPPLFEDLFRMEREKE